MNDEVTKMELPSRNSRQRTPGRIGVGVVNLRRGSRLSLHSRRLLLVYVGAWASVYDAGANLVMSGRRLIDSAERRGVRIEDGFVRRFRLVEEKTVDQLRQLQEGIKLDDAHATLDETLEQTQDGLTKRIQVVLDNLGIPSREQLERLNREIDQLNAKIDRELRRHSVHA